MSSLDLYRESRLQSIEQEIEHQDFVMKCAEDWGPGYTKDEHSHIQIMRIEARLERKIRKVFRDISKNAEKYVSWTKYKDAVSKTVKADVQVDVIVDDKIYDDLDDTFIRVTFDTFLLATSIGAQAAEKIYEIPLGIDTTDAIMLELTTKRLASLVGKRISYNPDGTIKDIFDNPNAEYRISDQTRKDINQSIKTSVSLRENRKDTTKRLMATIDSPKRAELIARTETINAYSQGVLEYGQQSGATGKEWENVGATDVCAEYSAQGIIDINKSWGNHDGPAAHPNCRCSVRLAYPPEYPKAKS